MKSGQKRKSQLPDIVCTLPVLVFVLSIVLVRLHLFSMPMTDIYWSEATNDSTISDLFNYWKAIAIIGSACLAILILTIAYLNDSIRLKKTYLYVPILVYISFVLLSFALSDYKYFALHGMAEHFEGTIVLISYMFMVLFLVNVIDSERRLKIVIYCTLIIAFVLGIIGITQASGNDFFSTTTGQKLITPNYILDTGISSWEMIDILAASGQKLYNFSFADGEVYQTVYNINYVPLYLILLIPIITLLFILVSSKGTNGKRVINIVPLALFALCIYNFFAANSASGYFGLAGFLIIGLFLFHKYFKLWAKPIICLIIVFGLIVGITSDRWMPELTNFAGQIDGFGIAKVYADNANGIDSTFDHQPAVIGIPVDYISTRDGELQFCINGSVLRVTRDVEHSSYNFFDENGNTLYFSEINNQPGYFEILDKRFHDYIKVSLRNIDGKNHVILSTAFYDWPFYYEESSNCFLFRNPVGKYVLMPNYSQKSGTIRISGSGRDRIWSSTVPLLGHYVLHGAGADCFAFVFPQNDYVSLYNTGPLISGTHSLNLVTDKAHNLYMQYWVNTGFISLLAWFAIVGYYLIGAFKQFRKRGFVDFCDFVNGGIFCGICGFLAVAFFNDGSVNTMPMFYTMLGTGLAINMRDKWPGKDPVGEMSGSDSVGPGEGMKKGKKAKAAAEVMQEM